MRQAAFAFLCSTLLLIGCYVQPYPGSVTFGPGGIAVNPPGVNVAGPQVAVAAPAVEVGGGEPETVVVPGTNVYVAPGLAEDVYFTDGYWWRNYGGGWYRSTCYGCGWAAYGYGAPGWYGGVHNWRYNYAHHQWNGHAWNEHAQMHGHTAYHGQNQVVHNQQQMQHGQQPHVSQASGVTTQSQPHKKKQSN